MIRALVFLAVIIIWVMALESFLSMAHAKQEQVRPERPVPTIAKPMPAARRCPPPIWIRFWVQDGAGGLKLIGVQIVEPRCAANSPKLFP
ncbi:UNVERIFIED_ORG: hypothetical protein GGI66_003623 [Rhizobium esperanzae]